MKKTVFRSWSFALLTAALCSFSFGAYSQGADCSTAEAVGVGTHVPIGAMGNAQEGFCFGIGGAGDAFWYSYTAGADGNLTVDACTNPADDDTRLSIGTGACGALVCETSNDDFCNTSGFASSITLAVTNGVTYYIQWDDRWDNTLAEWELSFVAPPPAPAEDCASATAVGDGTYPFDTGGNTASGVLPSCGGGTNPVDGWWDYTASCNGNATFSLCGSAFDTRIAIWDACAGVELACNDDFCGTQSEVTIAVTSGTHYFVQVGGFNGATGTGDLTISCVAPLVNDLCAGAIPIAPSAAGTGCGVFTFSLPFTSDGTTDSGVPAVCSDPGLDQWFTWTATTDGLLWSDGMGNPGIAIFANCADAAAGVAIDCANTFAGPDVQLGGWTIGDPLIIQIYDFQGSSSDVSFCLEEFTLPPPPPEECVDAVTISCGSVTAGSNVGATVNGMACTGNNVAPDVWYTFVGANSLDPLALPGTPGDAVTLSTCNDASYDTKIDVFTGTCGALVCVGGNDDGAGCSGFTSEFNFATTVGTTYYVMISGFGATSEGTFNLTMSCAPPCLPVPLNDDCMTAEAVAVDAFGSVVMTPGDNTCAANALANPTCDAFASIQDVWFTFTTTTETVVTLYANALGMTDMNIVVYEGACGGVEVLCMDPFASPQMITVVPATDYFVQVYSDGSAGEGTFEIGVEGPPPPPANDLCAGAPMLSCPAAVNGSSFGATATDAPGACGGSGADNAGVWYQVMGTGNDIRVALCTTSFDSRVAIYSGACGALVCVDGSDDDCGDDPDVTFASTMGTTYWIYIDGFGGATGDYYMEVICLSAPVCVDNALELEINTDDFGSETTWEIRPEAFINPIASGGSYPDNSNIIESICLPNGCYDLEVFDAFGDGICCGFGMGNFELRTAAGERIIISDGQYGASAQVSRAFCVPLGPTGLTIATCDDLELTNSSILVASEMPMVTAQYGITDATSGYQFWIFDPNGGYSRRIFLSHANPGTGGPPGALAAAHLQLHNVVSFPIPALTFLNVRIRPRVAGVNSPFGRACTMMIDPAAAACPTTQLDDNPLHVGTTFSCGVIDMDLDGSDKIWAEPIPAANRYQFEFAIPGEGFLRRIAMNSYVLTLVDSWVTKPLEYGKTYNVTVRASFDGGANWCPFGDVCTVSTSATPPANASNRDVRITATVGLWPNPTTGENVNLTIDEIAVEYDEIIVEIHDAFGKRVHTETIANQGNTLNTVLNLDGDLSSGIYVVNIIIGNDVMTERLIVQ